MALLEEIDGDEQDEETVQGTHGSEKLSVDDPQNYQVEPRGSSSSSSKADNIGRDFDLLVAFKRLDACTGDLAKLRCAQDDFIKRQEDTEIVRQGQFENFSERLYELEQQIQKADAERQDVLSAASGTFLKQHAEAQHDRQNLLSAINQVNQNFERVSHEIRRHDLMLEETQQSLAHAMHTLDLLSMELREQNSVVQAMQQSFESAGLQAKMQTQQVTELHAALQAVQQNVTRTAVQHFEEQPRRAADNLSSQLQLMDQEIRRLHIEVEQMRKGQRDMPMYSPRALSQSREHEHPRTEARVAVDVEHTRHSSVSPSRRVTIPLSGASSAQQTSGSYASGNHHMGPVQPLISGSGTPIPSSPQPPVMLPGHLSAWMEPNAKERLAATPGTPRQAHRMCVSPPSARATFHTYVRSPAHGKVPAQSPVSQSMIAAQRQSHTVSTSRARSLSDASRHMC